MDVTVERLSPVLLELRAQVPIETVKLQLDEAYARLKQRARVRGFRPGKAPRHVLAQLYGRSVQADVSKRLVEETLSRALSDRNLQALSQPEVEPGEVAEGKIFSFKARFEVRPEVAEVIWKGIEAKRPSTEVTDATIDEEIHRLRAQHATVAPVADERGAREGDVVTLGLSFDLDGKPGTEEVETEIGRREILRDIEQALLGMRPGETKQVRASFPGGHPNPALRGRQADFAVELRELKERLVPELDDEFAKDCGEYDSLDALRADLREQVAKRLGTQAEQEVARQLVAQLCEKNPIPVPPSLVAQQAQMGERELVAARRARGEPPDIVPALRESLRAEAEIKVRAGLLMAEIARQNNLTVTPEDLERGYAELAEQSGKNVAKIKAEYKERSQRETLMGMILEDKVLDLLVASAKIAGA
ncbi:MAG: trigger factor [Deltaproteobacteria bacterium]|nr:trigger factor [Deltaproteobacteria bacterium]